MAVRVAAKLAAGLKTIGPVNPLHYRAMLRFFEMDREDATFTGLVWDVSYLPYPTISPPIDRQLIFEQYDNL